MNHNNTRQPAISSIRAIAMILAHGILRLQNLEKRVDNLREESVHHDVLSPKGEAK